MPHRVRESTCYVNGLEDILAWKGTDYMEHLLSVVGGMAGFTYLRFKRTVPPCMVYWGANTKYLMRDLSRIIGFKEIVIEGKSFKNTFPKLKESLDEGQPVVAGALDMYYLHYYRALYKKQHLPIHYVLVVGYDDNEGAVFVHDCSKEKVQKIAYDEFEKSLDVKVPGMSKKNTIRTFSFAGKIPSEFEVGKKGFSFKAEKFLHPPVSLFGLPAMRKLTDEILRWDDKRCFEHMVVYATTPPTLPKSLENSHGMRFWQASVLESLGKKYHVNNWLESAKIFRQSGEKIVSLCEAALRMDNKTASETLAQIADLEQRGYELLKDRKL